MGTIHHQISAQKAPVLHSATVDFVMSNSQVLQAVLYVRQRYLILVIGNCAIYYCQP